MDALAEEYGVQPVSLPTLKRAIGIADVAALVFLIRQIRAWRPQILHTHTAKAGALGRTAALLAGRRRPAVVVHTFHGHVLAGYFSRPVSLAFTWLERLLARFTTCLIAVSEEVRADLIRLGVAPPDRIVVVPLGLDFSRFDAPGEERRMRREALRRSLGIPLEAPVVTLVGRLEPIKRVDRFLRIANLVEAPARFLVVGDGALREELQQSPEAASLGDRLFWAGMRDDMPDVYFASDVLAVTSDNEGTAVTAIEAHAAGLPVVTTRVGGMASVVVEGESGVLSAPEDEAGLAKAVTRLVLDESESRRLGAAGEVRVRQLFALDRLVSDVDALYRRLLPAGSAHERPRAAMPANPDSGDRAPR
jgi:glycosyltransferase involved in cell wall biosynthesis